MRTIWARFTSIAVYIRVFSQLGTYFARSARYRTLFDRGTFASNYRAASFWTQGMVSIQITDLTTNMYNLCSHTYACSLVWKGNFFNSRFSAQQLLNFPFKSNIPLEYCIIEVVFSELLSLPSPRYIEIFYFSLLLELCKLKPYAIPQVNSLLTQLTGEPTMNWSRSCLIISVSLLLTGPGTSNWNVFLSSGKYERRLFRSVSLNLCKWYERDYLCGYSRK